MKSTKSFFTGILLAVFTLFCLAAFRFQKEPVSSGTDASLDFLHQMGGKAADSQKDGALLQNIANLPEDNAALSLSGEYVVQNYMLRMSYSFDRDGNVAIRFFIGGFPVHSQQGTYEIDTSGKLIALSFPYHDGIAYSSLPGGLNSISGTFSFRLEDDCIWIGTVCCQKAGAHQNTDSMQPQSPAAGEEPVKLDGIHLELPAQYSISYLMEEEGFGLSRAYTQTMARTDEGIFLDLGASNERYVFELLDSGKYMQYRYNSLTGKYETPMAMALPGNQIAAGTMALDMLAASYNVVSGYAARVDTYFDFYEAFRGYMAYQAQEVIGGISCQKYTASLDSPNGRHSAELWIDPITGLCVKGIYQYQSAFQAAMTKTFLCTDFETEEAALPSYK